jgi:AcrR family transcriptional regulator
VRNLQKAGISRRHKGDRRWEEILAISSELFARQSYHGTSLDEIALKLGIGKTSLYHYVDSKEAILGAIYDRMMGQAEAAIRPLMKLAVPPEERLRRMVHAYILLIASDVDTWSLLHHGQNALGPENLRALLRRKRDYERKFEKVIEEGQAQRVFRPLPTRLLVLGIFGACNYVHYWLRFTTYTAEEVAANLLTLLERGWTSDASDHRAAAYRRDLGSALTGMSATLEQLGDDFGRLKSALGERAAG